MRREETESELKAVRAWSPKEKDRLQKQKTQKWDVFPPTPYNILKKMYRPYSVAIL